MNEVINHIKTRRNHLKERYGMSTNQMVQMVLSQNNKCAICHKEFTEPKHRHVDHSHLTKEIRQLLCTNCNHGLGNFKESIEILADAIKYLNKWR
jgi:nitrate/TMAO reductase-like tetraheme cytochrome c subunit